ncbi:MAG: DUF1800 domain-containing protein [Alphaproteobacteria bacterium]|nr:DUF1800 domain-containing protein [Alphaproteobacteria bacterium SS10]
MTSIQASIAASRFGLGVRPGELDGIARDHRGWILSQIQQPAAVPRQIAAMPSSAQLGNTVVEMLTRGRRMRGMSEDVRRTNRQQMTRNALQMYRNEAIARTQSAIQTTTPVYERLVHFWSNHFTVSASKNEARPFLGGFEREVIRPNVLGKFGDMLLASTRHVAMLLYLDQAQSIGPNSIAGRFGDRGLNENLAREILELHTLGVDGGYGQDDVLALSKMLTGWTVGGIRAVLPERAQSRLPEANGGDFIFAELFHEPGAKTLLGKSFPEAGEGEARAALAMLATHPSTARFIATKLARHFIADDPPQRAIDQLAAVFLNTGGDLRAVTMALVDLPEVWADPLPKVRSPNDFVIALARAANVPVPDQDLLKGMRDFGQPVWSAPSPAGWPDTAQAWLAPESLMRRVDAARSVAQAIPNSIEPMAFLEDTIGPVANADTAIWTARAPDRVEAIGLVLASPEFQRR